MACETHGSPASKEQAVPVKRRMRKPGTERTANPARREFFRTFRRVWMLTKSWTRDFDRKVPGETEFLSAVETRLHEINEFSYPEAACKGILIISGKSRPFDFETISTGLINQLTRKKEAEMQLDPHEVSHYCRSLRGLRGLLMHEFAHQSYILFLKGAKEIFPELEAEFPKDSQNYWETKGERLRTIFEVMLYGLKQKAESEEQFSQAEGKFYAMLFRETDIRFLREGLPCILDP